MDEELKPCPFCGSRDGLKIKYNRAETLCRIMCEFCHVSTQMMQTSSTIKCWNDRPEQINTCNCKTPLYKASNGMPCANIEADGLKK